jgi:hypothetical protein
VNRLIISGFVTVALLAVATTMLRSHSLPGYRTAGTTSMASSQQHHSAADVSKLPVEEFEDMSLVYSSAPKR